MRRAIFEFLYPDLISHLQDTFLLMLYRLLLSCLPQFFVSFGSASSSSLPCVSDFPSHLLWHTELSVHLSAPPRELGPSFIPSRYASVTTNTSHHLSISSKSGFLWSLSQTDTVPNAASIFSASSYWFIPFSCLNSFTLLSKPAKRLSCFSTFFVFICVFRLFSILFI